MAFMPLIFPVYSHFLKEKRSSKSGNTNSAQSEKTENRQTFFESMKEHKLSTSKCFRAIITGPDTAEKTSLVFQAAVTAATSGVSVTYISTHPLKRLPTPVHGMPTPEPDAMKNVDFVYLEDCQSLISWFAGVHTRASVPGLIILEDLLTYACQLNDNQLERSFAKLCAIIVDALSWIDSTNNGQACQIVMTGPSRTLSLANVLHQFSLHVAEYSGYSVGQESEISFWDSERNESMRVKFKHHKDCLLLTEVTAAKT